MLDPVSAHPIPRAWHSAWYLAVNASIMSRVFFPLLQRVITPLSHLEIVMGILSIINEVRAGSQGNSLIYVLAAERLTLLDDQRGCVASGRALPVHSVKELTGSC